MNCDPQTLANAARCFTGCIPAGGRRAIKTFLLCQIGNVGLSGNIVPADATCQAGSYTLAVKANTTYQITWGSETSVTICGDVYASPGVGGITVVYTGACTAMVFACGAGAITTRVSPSSKTPVPSGFTWTLSANGANAVASWGTVPGFVENTELWTSTDNVTFALAATVAAPATTTTIAGPTSGAVLYAKIRFVDLQASPQSGAFTSVLNVPDVVTAAWAATVISNGGAAVSVQRVKDADVFYLGLVSDGIVSKILHLNFIDSSNLTAARCPIIHTFGNSIWSFVGGAGWAINQNGLTFNNAGSAFDTGFNPSTAFANDTSAAIAVCAFTIDGLITAMAGYANNAQSQVWDLFPYIGVTTSCYIRCWDATNGQLQTGHDVTIEGYYCGTRVAANDLKLFHANSTIPHHQLGTLATTGGTRQNTTCYACGSHNTDTGLGVNDACTCSLVAFCTGLTAAESALLQARFTTFRAAVGGGWP